MNTSFLDDCNVHPNYVANCIFVTSGDKHVYTRSDGTIGHTASFMMMPALRQGYEWRDESPIGSEWHHWVEKPVQPRPDRSTIFGYDAREFMARQYK